MYIPRRSRAGVEFDGGFLFLFLLEGRGASMSVPLFAKGGLMPSLSSVYMRDKQFGSGWPSIKVGPDSTLGKLSLSFSLRKNRIGSKKSVCCLIRVVCLCGCVLADGVLDMASLECGFRASSVFVPTTHQTTAFDWGWIPVETSRFIGYEYLKRDVSVAIQTQPNAHVWCVVGTPILSGLRKEFCKAAVGRGGRKCRVPWSILFLPRFCIYGDRGGSIRDPGAQIDEYVGKKMGEIAQGGRVWGDTVVCSVHAANALLGMLCVYAFLPKLCGMRQCGYSFFPENMWDAQMRTCLFSENMRNAASAECGT